MPIVVAYLVGHLVLARAIGSPGVATLHVLATVVVVGLVCVLARTPLLLLMAGGYVAGCDVLWRMTEAEVPWELAKYLLAAIALWGLLRFTDRRHRALLPLAYLAALVPGVVATVDLLGFEAAQEPLSFALAGPLALALLTALCRHLRASRGALVDVLWTTMGPSLAVTAIAWDQARALAPEDFHAEASNVAASGGYGPNQVSTLLGLGVLLVAALFALDRRPILRVVALALGVWFLIEAGLTFSRGGLVGLTVAVLLAVPHFLGRQRRAVRLVGMSVLAVGLAVVAVLPTVQRISGGEFGDRATNLGTTLRTDISTEDLRLFRENPVDGVGAGLADGRRELEDPVPSHTEQTRLLAEHGLLGLVALGLLVAMAVSAYRRQEDFAARAWTLSLVGWTAATMAHSATRLAAVSFAFGLASLTVALRTGHDGGRSTVATDANLPDPHATMPVPRRGAGGAPAGGIGDAGRGMIGEARSP